MRRDLVLGAVLTLLAAVIWWLAAKNDPHEQTGKDQSRRPDYYLRDFTTIFHDAQGKPERILSGTEMRHYPDDSFELDSPRLVLAKEDGSRWIVISEDGKISEDGNILMLTGKVEIEKRTEQGIVQMRIETRDLVIYPEQNLAETQASVQIIAGKNQMYSNGMRLWFQSPAKIKLLSNVRGYYEIH